MKATFQLSLLTDPSVPVVLFNVPLAQDSSIDSGTGLNRWEFGSTPVMSSYIVAFALGKPLDAPLQLQLLEHFTTKPDLMIWSVAQRSRLILS